MWHLILFVQDTADDLVGEDWWTGFAYLGPGNSASLRDLLGMVSSRDPFGRLLVTSS